MPLGACRISQGNLAIDRQFTCQILDSTGLYYYNARYYDPTIGRFISADTIVEDAANPQTLNRYSYCQNNPMNSTDPSGHFDLGKIIAGLTIIVGWDLCVELPVTIAFIASFAVPPVPFALIALETVVSTIGVGLNYWGLQLIQQGEANDSGTITPQLPITGTNDNSSDNPPIATSSSPTTASSLTTITSTSDNTNTQSGNTTGGETIIPATLGDPLPTAFLVVLDPTIPWLDWGYDYGGYGE